MTENTSVLLVPYWISDGALKEVERTTVCKCIRTEPVPTVERKPTPSNWRDNLKKNGVRV